MAFFINFITFLTATIFIKFFHSNAKMLENKAFLKKVISDVTDMECEFKKKLVLDEDNTVDYLKSMFGNDITIKK